VTGSELNNLLVRADIALRTNWLHALNLLDEAEKIAPDEARIYGMRGEILMDRQLHKRAIEAFQKALALAPDQVHFNYLIGNCYLAQSEYRMALVYYEKTSPLPPEISYNRALALAILGRLIESTSVLRETIKEGIYSPYYYYLLIEQLIRLKSFDEALVYTLEALDRFGPVFHLRLFQATIYCQKGIWLKGYHIYNQLNQERPFGQPDQLQPFANSAWKIGNYKHAIELFEKLLEIDPYVTSGYEEYLRLLLETDRFSQARAVMRKARQNLGRLSPVLLLIQERINQEGQKPDHDL